MSRTRHLLLAGCLALIMTACNGDDPGPDEDATPAVDPDAPVEIDVIGGDIFYQPDGVELPAGATLVVHFTNEGAQPHDFALEDGQGTGILDPGASETAELGPFDESTVAICTVPGHRESGMEFNITVTD